MDYRRKLKKRLYYALGYIVIGIALILLNFFGKNDEVISCFGTAFVVCGVVRVVQYIRLIGNKDKMKQREIAEKDERNIMLWTQARSLTFGIYTALAGTAVMVLYCVDQDFIGQIIAYTVCALIFIYWICYLILRRKY